MSNTYFQFKQFRIDQENSAMKVCTDSCILGAWTNTEGVNSILDIGTGTGLLALMLAQRSTSQIDAVEIDAAAAQQAKDNVANSPWSDRIQVVHSAIQEFAKTATKKYDLIISNPPFYSNYLKSEKENINVAYHSVALPTEEFLAAASSLISPAGRLIVLLPPYEAELMREEALNVHLYASKILHIKDTALAKVNRDITVFTRELTIPSLSELVIKEGDTYTESFVTLLKEYYLNL